MLSQVTRKSFILVIIFGASLSLDYHSTADVTAIRRIEPTQHNKYTGAIVDTHACIRSHGNVDLFTSDLLISNLLGDEVLKIF